MTPTREPVFADANERQRAVQRGEVPALNVRQLVDAQRQCLAGAGADLYTIRLLLSRREFGADLTEAVERLAGHVSRLSKVSTLAFEAAPRV